jgi:hypothetical protein
MDLRHAALPAVVADDLRRLTMTVPYDTMTGRNGARLQLAAYSEAHWERTKMSFYQTALLLTFATISLTSLW